MAQKYLQREHMKFSLPLIFSFITQQFYSIVDAIMVGKLIGAPALAAVGNAATAAILFTAISGGIEIGIQIAFSRYNPQTQKPDILNAALAMGIVDLLLGILLGILALSQCTHIMRLLHIDPTLLEMSRAYFEIYVYGLAVIFLYDSSRAVLMGCGDSKSPFYLVLASSFCNIILDYFFIMILRLGAAGAALATIMSNGIGLLLAMPFLHRILVDNAPKHSFHLDWTILAAVGRVTLPSICQQLVLSLCSFALQMMINDLGVEIVSGYTAAAKVINLYTMALAGFCQGFSLMSSRKIGEGFPEKVITLRKAAMQNCLSYYLLIVIIVFINGENLISLFFDDAGYKEAFSFGCNYLRVMSIFFIFSIFKYLNEDGLKSFMQMKKYMCSNFADIVIRLVSCYFLTKWIGAYGLCFSFLAGTLSACFISHAFLFSTFRKHSA